MKSGFWQVQIAEEDRYKTGFNVPFGHYEWNVMPFGLKNAPSEFQNIMNDIILPLGNYAIVYIDDVSIFSNSLDQHFKHLNAFYNIIHKNGLVVSPSKMSLFQTEIRFLGHNIIQGTIKPINRSLEFSNKFPNEIKDKKQLQRFLGCLNYIQDFFKDLGIICKPLYDRLKKNTKPWTQEHTNIVKYIKDKIKCLPCLHIPHPNAKLIVETDASDLGFGGILKQELNNKENLVRYYSGAWNDTQKNYSTIKKEILSIVLCIKKFEDDLYTKPFLLRIDCLSAKYILEKDIKNLISK
uniref:Putative reverse transcriptase domain-containing protein n=1 Tax=Helianthus annuus TaxID=4232 RepID=A0A251T983_HELAN